MKGKEIETGLSGMAGHVLLYAHNKYERRRAENGKTDGIHMIEDIREIMNKVMRVDIKYVSVSDVMVYVGELVAHIGIRFEPKKFVKFFPYFFMDVTIESRGAEDTIDREFLMRRFIGFLGDVKLTRREDGLVINIGEPDEKILPVARKL